MEKDAGLPENRWRYFGISRGFSVLYATNGLVSILFLCQPDSGTNFCRSMAAANPAAIPPVHSGLMFHAGRRAERTNLVMEEAFHKKDALARLVEGCQPRFTPPRQSRRR